MAKQLNVNLAFTANTSQAKSQLQDLQNQLSKLTSASAQQLNIKWTDELQEATTAAVELKTHLQNATNIQTGNLDFTKLNASIKKSGKSLAAYGQQLYNLGPAGQAAFMSLANAVAQSEIPIKRSNAALQEMMTTLKNTARWQLSSSMLHGFMGAIQSAYGYAQDLNESLNNIRIVTGQNIDQMAKFAEQANKAAKVLSTSTTDYTDASLIYYQQGLNDAEVAKRTEVTIKMANAAGQSAQVVSDQLTSVWNNFYDGSKSLEYYADVMTALGAATASSTDEIAGGLEKFAAIADTIGLSYEYAASALATITSNTRQSEEVVGTALKTIFARIQGLNLGETLDDGTTLNKYSAALQSIGVDIFDATGEIKKMDTILAEMAAKWETLAKNEQIALAQTVAGVRQYTQLVALMDNWDAGDADSMMANLKTAYDATGTLQKQADIYAESWEAAQDRVRAAAESIYSSLIDEDVFIGLLNGLEKVLSFVDQMIDSFGGLKGVLAATGVLMTKIFSSQMIEGVRNMAHNIYMSTEGGRQATAKKKQDTMKKFEETLSLGHDGIETEVGKVTSEQLKAQLQMQNELAKNSNNMSEDEIADAQQLLDIRKQIGDQIIAAKQKETESKDNLWDNKIKALQDLGKKSKDGIISDQKKIDFEKATESLKELEMGSVRAKRALDEMEQSGDISEDTFKELVKTLRGDANGAGGLSVAGISEAELDAYFTTISEGGENAKESLEELLKLIAGKSGNVDKTMSKMGVSKEALDGMRKSYRGMAEGVLEGAEATQRAAKIQAEYEKRLAASKVVIKDWATSIVAGAEAFMSFASIISTASSAIDTLTNPDLSGWEKFVAVLQSSAMIITMTVSMFNSLSEAQKNWQKGTLKNAAATLIEAAATTLSTKANEQNAKAQNKKADGHSKDAAQALKDAAATKLEGEVTEDSNKKLSDSFKQLKEAGGKWVKAFSKQIGGVSLIAAAIAVVIGTVSLAVNQYNEAAVEAEKAAKAAEQLSNQYQAVKENYDSLNTTVLGYEESAEAMKSLTKGTAAYNEELLKANEYAMELINKYGLFDKYSIQDGLITFDKGALDEVRQKQLDAMGKAQASSYVGQIAASHYAGQSNQTSLNRDINSRSDNWNNVGNTAVTTVAGLAAGGLGAGGAAMLGASIGTASLPVVGTVVGAIVGLIAGAITTAVVGAESKAEDAALDNITKYVAKNGDGIFAAKNAEEFGKMLSDAKLGIEDDKLVKSLYENRKAVRELTLAEANRLKQEEANFEAAFTAYNMSNTKYNELEVGQGYMNEQASSYRTENIDRVREEVDSLWSGSNNDFWAKYLEYIYNQENIDVANSTGENVRITNKGGKAVTVEKKNEEGVWETVGDKNGLDEDVAAEQLVNAMLLEEASANMNFDDLNALVSDLKKAGLTLKDDSALMDTVLTRYAKHEEETLDFNGLSYKDIMSIDTTKIEDGDFKTALEDARQNYIDNLSDMEKQLINDGYGDLLTPEFHVDEYQSIENAKKALEAAQSYIDSHGLSTEIQVKNAMIDALESGNLAEFKELFEKSELSKTLSYNEALEMGPEKLITFLKTGGQDLSDALNTSQASLDENTAALAGLREEMAKVNTEAYGEDGKADGVGGTDGAVVEAEKAEQGARDALAIFTAAVGYNPNEGDYVSIDDATGEAVGTRYNLETNKILAETGLPGFKKSGYAAYSTIDTSGSIEAILSPLQELMGSDNEFYKGITQYLEYINEAQSSEQGDWSDEAEAWMKSSFAPMLATWLSKSSEYDFYREAGWTEQAIIDYLAPYVYDNLYNGAYEGMVNSENAKPTYTILDAVRSGYMNGFEVATGQARTDHKETVDKMGDNSALSSDMTDLENQRTDILEDLFVQDTLLKQQVSNLGLEYEAVEFLAEDIQNISKDSELFSERLQKNKVDAIEVATAISRYNRAVATLSTNYDSWYKILSDKKNWSKHAEILGDLDEAYSDLLDLEIGTLSVEFLKNTEYLEEFKKAANGSDEAYNNLQKFATLDFLKNNGIKDLPDSLKSALAEFADIEGFEVGDLITYDGSPELFSKLSTTYTGLVNMLTSMGVAADAAMATVAEALSMSGFEPPTYELVELSGSVAGSNGEIPVPGESITVNEEGGPVTYEGHQWVRVPGEDGSFTYYALKVNGEGGFKKTAENVGGSTPPPPTGGGGGAKKLKRSKKSDIVDRYKEVNDKLDDVKDRMEDASRAADGLWGPERLTQMRNVISAMKDEVKLLKQKKIEAQSYLDDDRKDLINTIKENVGMTIGLDSFDANNNFIDYDEVMNQLWTELKAAEDAVKDEDNVTEDEQKAIDEVNERIEAVKSAIELYDTTKEELEDMDNQIADALLSIQQHNFELLTLELEMKITVNDADLKVLDYYLSKISDDIYGMAESLTLMYGAMDDSGKWDTANSQLDTYVKELGDYNNQLQLLKEQYTTIDPETGERMIDKASFIKGLEQIQDGIYKNLGNIEELKQSWKTFYADTLAAANEELSKFTDLMEHHTSVLEHYNNLLSLLGRSKNFEQIGVVLSAQVETAENMANVSRKAYEDAQQRAVAAKTAYDNSLTDDSLSEDDKEKIKNDWLAAQQAANEAQDKMLADAAAWAEALKAEVENKLEGLADVLKKAFSIEGYESIDEILTGMERKNTLQEEYLTQTNKIYETNKLIRQAQQEIDKTTNTAAKRRLAQFIEETSEMQDQNKLSQYELEIMQAKYDLRLAEIALEEAQNAKSTVRLQRDAEGNFGYVYTADQNQISDAEQQLADAENALYNIGLEGANKYSQKYAEAVSAMNDEITALTQAWASGEISSWEEYERQKKAITEHYGALLKDYSSLHAISLTTDSRVAQEAWSKDFNSMMGSTEEWMTAVEDYVGEVRGVFSDWETDMGRIAEYTVGKNLDDLAGKTGAIKTANEQLAESITKEGGVLDSLDKMILKIKTMLEGMGIFWDTIETIITDAEGTGEDIATIIENESDDDPSNDLQPVVSDDSTPPVEEPPKQDPPAPPPDDPESYKKGVVTFSGNGGNRVWTDEAGKTYAWNSKEGDELQTAFNRAAGRNGGYKGDYWLGWTKTGGKLNADVLHEKYGLATGGYTGDWEGSYGKLAFLHQKELVLNAKDTENFLASMEVLDRILKILDLQTLNSQLSGNISSPGLNMPQQEVLEQQIHIEAHFPDATDRNEIEEAFKSLADLATQYAHRR